MCLCVWHQNVTRVTCINISKLDEGIDPNLLTNDRYVNRFLIFSKMVPTKNTKKVAKSPDTKMSRAWHASIYQSWMKELIPIFWQMTDMVIDYTLEPFWVPDLHPRSQELPPKSRRVPDFVFNNLYHISWCFLVFWLVWQFCFIIILLRPFFKNVIVNVYKMCLTIFFTFFNVFGVLGVWNICFSRTFLKRWLAKFVIFFFTFFSQCQIRSKAPAPVAP